MRIGDSVAAAVERQRLGADRGTACRPCRPSPRRRSALAWSCGNHIAWQRRRSCDVARAVVARYRDSRESDLSSESGRRGSYGCRAPMYDSQLALIDLSNDQSRSIEGAHDGSVDCQQRRQRRRAARRARGAAQARPRRRNSRGGPPASGRTARTARRTSRASTASARSRSTRPSSRSKPIIRRSSRPRTSASRRSSTCSSAWPAA